MKHLYAYSSLGGIVRHHEAQKNVMNQKFYYDEDRTCELILKEGQYNNYFSLLPKSTIVINGNRYPVDSINESAAHFNFKMKIKKDECFFFGGNTIFLKNVKLEFIERTFRYDLKAELHCGTPCVIEIIRSSKTALKKENYLRKKQILTFEIFIDKDGNQKLRQFNLYGNQQLEQVIKERIASENRVKAIQNGLHYQKERERRIVDSEVDERITELNNILQVQRGIFVDLGKKENIHYSIQQYQLKEIGEAIKLCRKAKQEIKQSEGIYRESSQRIKDETESKEKFNERINKLKIEIEQSERQYEEIAKNCKIEWFAPKGMIRKNDLQEFKYWTT